MRHRADHPEGAEPGVRDPAQPEAAAADDALSDLDGVRSSRVRVGVGAGVIILIAALVAAVVISAVGQRGSGAEVGQPGAKPVSSGSTPGTGWESGSPGAVAGDDRVLVHVLGAVKRPGLVSLSAGGRVVDAVAAAGGLSDEAEVAGINLARPVADGEQLQVPRIGEPLPPPAAVPGAGQAAGPGAFGGPINVNTASQNELETLPRIGPALAQRILDWREANGRFGDPADLMKVSGIGQKLFDGLKDRITV